MKGDGKFYLFYTGIIHPTRPMEYRKLGHDAPWVWQGHKETQGLAVSADMTDWVKVADFAKGIGIPGRDSHVVRDAAGKRWLLYSTGSKPDGISEAYVSQSQDLVNWELTGPCAHFSDPKADEIHGHTTDDMMKGNFKWGCMTESLHVMKHPLSGKWIMMANWQYVLSDDPLSFRIEDVRTYDLMLDGKGIDIGFAGEMLELDGKWYRSGVIGKRDYWKLGFTEVEWVKDGAFRIVKQSCMV